MALSRSAVVSHKKNAITKIELPLQNFPIIAFFFSSVWGVGARSKKRETKSKGKSKRETLRKEQHLNFNTQLNSFSIYSTVWCFSHFPLFAHSFIARAVDIIVFALDSSVPRLPETRRDDVIHKEEETEAKEMSGSRYGRRHRRIAQCAMCEH